MSIPFKRTVRDLVTIPQRYRRSIPFLNHGGWAIIEGDPPFYWRARAIGNQQIFSNLWFILSGHVTIECDGRCYEGTPGCAMLRSSGLNEKIICHSTEFEHVYFQLYCYAQPGIIVRQTPDGFLTKELVMYLHRAEKADRSAFQLLSSVIQAHLTEEMQSKKFDRLLVDFERNVRYDVKTFAQKAGMSISTFQRFCLHHYGKSPQEVRMEFRMKKAISLLTGTNETLESIASMLGYSSAFAFSKAYMRYFGRRPGSDRKKPISLISDARFFHARKKTVLPLFSGVQIRKPFHGSRSKSIMPV